MSSLLPSFVDINLEHVSLNTDASLRDLFAENQHQHVFVDTPFLSQVADPETENAQSLEENRVAEAALTVHIDITAFDGGGAGHFAEKAERGYGDGAATVKSMFVDGVGGEDFPATDIDLDAD